MNLAVSEAFYTSLHVLEITLRNSIHDRMRALHGKKWFSSPRVITDKFQKGKVAETVKRFTGDATDGQIIAELTFGFWTAHFGKKNTHLWGNDLRPIFNASKPLQRKQIAIRLNDIRTLRNRIAHHESIIQLDLPAIHQETCEMIGWLSTDALAWCNAHCRFSTVHPSMPIIIGNLANPALPMKNLL